MKIKRIRLKNFLCFSGDDNEIILKDGLNLILGGNGYGKTKLFDAFNWVFFDWITNPEGTRSFTKDLKQKIVSKKTIEQTVQGEIECKVEVEIETKRGDYKIVRRYFINKNQSKILVAENSVVKVYEKGISRYILQNITSQAELIDFIDNKVIPSSILDHIWFQGERGISKAINTSNEEAVRSIINKISYVKRWDRYIEVSQLAFKRAHTHREKAITTSSNQKDKKHKIEAELEKIKKEIAGKEKKLEMLKDDLRKIQEGIEEITLSTEARENFQQVELKDSDLKYQHEKVSEELNLVIDRSDRSLFASCLIAYGTRDVANRFEELYQQYIYNKQEEIRAKSKNIPIIPRGVPQETHLRKMIKDERCHVCNQSATKGTPAYEHLNSLLPENYPTTIILDDNDHQKVFKSVYSSQAIVSLEYDSFKKRHESDKAKFTDIKKRQIKVKREIEKCEEEKIHLITNFGVSSIGHGVGIANKYRRLNEKTLSISTDIATIQSSLRVKLAKQEKLDLELMELLKDKMDPSINKKYQFFKSLKYAMKEARKSQFAKMIQLLEDQTNFHYDNINLTSGAFLGKIKFKRIDATEGYSIQIVDYRGEDVTSNMNTSQILTMQLSILLGILSTNKQKGLNKRYPLIADAPNASFDIKKRKFLFKEIANTFDQAVIMMFEYLINDSNRKNRYALDQVAIEDLRDEVQKSGKDLNIIMLDIPDEIDPKKLSELSIEIKQL